MKRFLLRSFGQRALAVLVLGLPAATVSAGDDLSAALDRCAAIEEQRIRIRCFESLDQPSRDAEPAPAPAPAKPLAETPPATQSRVANLHRRPRGEYVFVLANGETWTEIEAGSNHYQRGMPVRIESTLTGAHMLTTTHGRATRVRLLD